MATQNTINLLKRESSLSPLLQEWEGKLKAVSAIAVGILFFLGAILGIGYFVVNQQEQQVEQTRKRLIAQIASEQQKESLFLSIKERIGVVQKAMNEQLSWHTVLDAVTSIGTPPALSAISVDEKNELTLTLKTTSFDETVAMIDRALALVKQKRIRSPRISSLQVDKDGTVQLSLSFTPVFTTTP